MERRRSSGRGLSVTSPVDGRQPTLPNAPGTEQEKEDQQEAALEEAQHNAEPSEPTQIIEPGSGRVLGDMAFEPEPPPLNYSLRPRYLSIVIFWSLILIDCIAMPVALYFGLWYGTNLSPNVVFSIVTAALGGISIFEYFLRLRRLLRKNSTCRVIGARRMYLDWFHWNFTLGWMIIMIELIVYVR